MPFLTKEEINTRKAKAFEKMKELLSVEDESRRLRTALVALEAESDKIREDIRALLKEESVFLIPLKITTEYFCIHLCTSNFHFGEIADTVF